MKDPRALIGGRQRAALIAILALQQRGEERLALDGFIGHALVDQHRLYAAALSAGGEELTVGVAQGNPRQLRFFSNSCCLPEARFSAS